METTKGRELQRRGSARKGKSMRECCCMCGDVGFEEQLFRCNKCNYRFQHIYCSRLYRSLEDKVETCEWCLDLEAKEKSLQQSSAKRKPQSKDNASRHESGCKAEDSQQLQAEKCNSKVLQSQPIQSTNNNGGGSAKGLGRRYRLLSEVLY